MTSRQGSISLDARFTQLRPARTSFRRGWGRGSTGDAVSYRGRSSLRNRLLVQQLEGRPSVMAALIRLHFGHPFGLQLGDDHLVCSSSPIEGRRQTRGGRQGFGAIRDRRSRSPFPRRGRGRGRSTTPKRNTGMMRSNSLGRLPRSQSLTSLIGLEFKRAGLGQGRDRGRFKGRVFTRGGGKLSRINKRGAITRPVPVGAMRRSSSMSRLEMGSLNRRQGRGGGRGFRGGQFNFRGGSSIGARLGGLNLNRFGRGRGRGGRGFVRGGARGRGGGGRGGGRGRRGFRGRSFGGRGKAPNRDLLDRELDDYMSSTKEGLDRQLDDYMKNNST